VTIVDTLTMTVIKAIKYMKENYNGLA